jgi:hypothetical protein
MKKSRITEHVITQPGAVEKLKRDGYTRSDIMQSMYKITRGASDTERKHIVNEIFKKN